MEDIPSSTLRKRRAQLLRQMPALDTLLRGSLIERYKRCGKPGCKCADGPGHGPKYYLSVSFPGRRPQMDYVPQADYADVTQRLANYHRVREIIEEIDTTAPKRPLGDSHVCDPLAVCREVNLVDGNSGKKRQELPGAGVITYQFATRLEARYKYPVTILTG